MNGAKDLVVLFLGESNFGNIGSMVPALAGGFEAAGLTPAIVDLRDAGYESELARLAATGRIAALVSVSGFGLPPTPDSNAVDVFNKIGAPVLGVFLDHPFCLRDRIDLPLTRYAATFPALHAPEFCRRYIRPGGAFGQLAHGATLRPEIPWSDRDIGLLLTGSLFLPPETQRAAWRDHGEGVEQNLNDIVDAARADLARPLEVSVRAVIGEGAGFDGIFPYMKTADDYIRNAQRVEVVFAMAGLCPTVVGPGWEIYADQLPDVTFVGETTIAEALRLTDRAGAVVNPFPGYNDSHERVFNAMAGSTAVLSSRSAYYDQVFTSSELFTLPNDAEDVPEAIDPLLKDEDGLRTMAAAGRTAVETAHTWTHRAAALMEIAGIQPFPLEG